MVYTLGIYYFMKKISLAGLVSLTGILFSTSIASAQSATDLARGMGTFAGLVEAFTQGIVKSLATLLLSAALLAFFYGIVEYIWARRKGDAKGVSDGNTFITWSLVALFSMFSVYGIIKLGQNVLFDGKDVSTIEIPNFTFKQGNAGSVQIGATPGLGGGTVPGGNPATPGLGGGGSPTTQFTGTLVNTLKSNAYSCTYDSECQSGFCDPVDNTCTNPSQAALKPNGFSCISSPQCQSGFCDPSDNTCSAPAQGGSGLGEGVGCADTPQCAPGLTCVGRGADKVCTSDSGSSSSSGLPSGSSCSGFGQGPCANGLECLESICQ